MQPEKEIEYLEEKTEADIKEDLMTYGKKEKKFKAGISPFSIEVISLVEESSPGIVERDKESDFELLKEKVVRNYNLNYEYMSDAKRLKTQKGGGFWWGDLVGRSSVENKERIEFIEGKGLNEDYDLTKIFGAMIILMTGVWLSHYLTGSGLVILSFLMSICILKTDMTPVVEKVESSKWWKLRNKKKELI